MVKFDAAWLRKQRIQDIAASAARLPNDGTVRLSKFVALMSYNHGVKKDRVFEYLETIQDLGWIELDREEDKIVNLKASNKEIAKK